MHPVLCTEERHAGQILAIFNEAIVNSTALYDYKPRAPESMAPGSRPSARMAFR
jgi:L-amino acid N-acyltransferase YncA